MKRKKKRQPIRYKVVATEPRGHLLTVAVTIPPPQPQRLLLSMPAWTPGSYKVRDFARNVQDVEAKDARGTALVCKKVDKQTWSVEARTDRTVTVRYRVYANELGVRASQFNDTHVHLNGASVFMAVAERGDEPCEVELVRPRSWSVATPLARLPRSRWRAESFDELVDSPIELGRFDAAHFREEGVVHRIVVCGGGAPAAVDLARDFQRIVRAGSAMFGGLPYRREYIFFLHSAPKRGGGLEHRHGSSIVVDRDTFHPRSAYLDFLQLVSHEHFHVWNGKRLRPRALGPFDYSREVYTRMLWVVEGWTCYYEKLLLRHAELATVDELLELYAKSIEMLREVPGRAVQSLSEASFDAWIKLYQADENTVNSTVSYYLKGEVVALLLDLEIRKRTKGKADLSEVMRRLFAAFPETGPGYPDEAVRQVAEGVAGSSLRRFFDAYVDGTAALDFSGPLAAHGLVLQEKSSDEAQPQAYLGARLKYGPDGVHIGSVLAGGPAAFGGLEAGDELCAVDGLRVSRERLDRFLKRSRPGDRAGFTVFRADVLRTVEVALGRRPPRLAIVPVPRAGRAAQRLRRAWLRG